ncbi:P-II family nitrogen regulator [bacterium endosymbiont of Bathymodiolus sp. 5 South]|jgi:nitrogen regulatory protein PII|uniref:P-II family nitrogen regulator n=1 Tax=bacterium endosymbiont of Bathymodiolus sp. 5 South TaxID=1181670 RepID=UPI0010B8FAB1|nr:P-II family nitrogen regulator [bacterium endosymbiont of Bathymodiolus sp. 5 South]CAC9434835.1 Putative regulatory protein, P-II family [uncultured Gammaproteobacteria bacterium]CAC9637182.1 Putative regulatory protein, P-II family [uncultured Gammaproteobacteria bacterium]CAC9651646.1 Putative regulatory protein, P-II family [uncultured Gammaproteobacteria bacterium]SHN89697.1 Putative regulatory protein, P-II family [bacterium endosymbiont of Bathymodiolus sp. 5 South]SSC08660.1 Nitroge
MHFKLIIAFVDSNKTDLILESARDKGATGSTIISQARGEGLKHNKTFLGLSLETPRDVLLLLVEQHLARDILETIAQAGDFERNAQEGIAFQIDVEDALGVAHQIQALTHTVKEKI